MSRCQAAVFTRVWSWLSQTKWAHVTLSLRSRELLLLRQVQTIAAFEMAVALTDLWNQSESYKYKGYNQTSIKWICQCRRDCLDVLVGFSLRPAGVSERQAWNAHECSVNKLVGESSQCMLLYLLLSPGIKINITVTWSAHVALFSQQAGMVFEPPFFFFFAGRMRCLQSQFKHNNCKGTLSGSGVPTRWRKKLIHPMLVDEQFSN